MNGNRKYGYIPPTEKKCKLCGEIKPLNKENWYKNAPQSYYKDKPYGWMSKCRACVSGRYQQRYHDVVKLELETNPEQAIKVHAYSSELRARTRCEQYGGYITQCHKERELILRLYRVCRWANYFQGIDSNSSEATEMDHIHPLSKQGSHTLENLQVLSRGANVSKSNKVI